MSIIDRKHAKVNTPYPYSSRFRFMEAACGGVSNRGRVVDANNFKPTGHEDYHSVYMHDASFGEYISDPHTGKGVGSCKYYRGPVQPRGVHFDIDAGDDLDKALANARTVTTRMVESYDVPPETLSIHFSGSKGFHIEIPAPLFNGIEASEEAPQLVKEIAWAIMGDVKMDPVVYDRNRLWRTPNTVNGKTGLYKVPLTYDELMDFDMDVIRQIAQNPRELESKNGHHTPVLALVSLKNSSQQRKKVGRGTTLMDRSGLQPVDDATFKTLVAEIAEFIPTVGSRHEWALYLAGFLLKRMPADQALQAMIDAWAVVGAEGDDLTHELEDIVESTDARIEDGDNVSGGPRMDELTPGALVALDKVLNPKTYAATDLGNAARLIRRHGNDIRWVDPWKKWVVWTGVRWEVDNRQLIFLKAKDTAIQILAEAAETADDDKRKMLVKHATASQSASKIRAMLDMAKSEASALPEDFDTDPYLLNVKNGTLDLRTGTLLPHERGRMITKLAPVEYDPRAKSPEFFKMMSRILPDYQLRKFVQRGLGYSLTGKTSEQVIFIPWGKGANGKSTLLEIVMDAMGDYAQTASQDLLLDKQSGHPTEVADLYNARLSIASEVKEGAKFDEARIKRLTGERYIKARRMHEDNWTFPATFKIWVPVNHRPTIRDSGDAIWRRLKLIPFTVQIPKPEQDKKLPEKLSRELPGILAWLVRGAVRWNRDGLGEPHEVTEATEEYRADMDVLQDFIAEKCVVADGATVIFSDLWEEYLEWAPRADALTKDAFSKRLTDKGFTSGKGSKGVRIRRGIGLAYESPSEGGRVARGGHDSDLSEMNQKSPGATSKTVPPAATRHPEIVEAIKRVKRDYPNEFELRENEPNELALFFYTNQYLDDIPSAAAVREVLAEQS